MFLPLYKISPLLLKNIKQVAVLTAELNQKSFSKIITVEMSRNARALSAYSSTSIEGNPLPLAEVKRILKNTPVNIRDTEREVLNYNRALEYLEKIIKQGKFKINLPLILSVQKIVTEKLIEKYRWGKVRVEPVFVNNPQTRQPIYLPPDAEDAWVLLRDLIDFLAVQKESLDPLILAGLFHKQFVIIHPFIDGNGRAARLLTKFLLAGLGLNTFNLFSFENYYNKNVDAYFKKVGLMGDYYELAKKGIDFTDWLEYFVEGILDELWRVKKKLETMAISASPRLRPIYAPIIDYLKKKGSISDREYAQFSKRAKSTRALDFKNLIQQKIIERFGQGKNTFYRLKK